MYHVVSFFRALNRTTYHTFFIPDAYYNSFASLQFSNICFSRVEIRFHTSNIALFRKFYILIIRCALPMTPFRIGVTPFPFLF